MYRALHKPTGDFVAIKHIDLEGSDDDIHEIQQEISLLATCHSEYVTRYRTSFVRGTKLWIVMEFLGGGSCLDLLKPCPKGLDERYIAIILRELLCGLDYLHATGKIHRDIKAANILLAETGHVKIADFGVAAQLTNIKSQRLTFVGTPFWMAPEVIQEAGYDYRADIWSLGITAMELATGEPPRADVHPMKVLFLIPKEKPPRLEGARFSKELKDFVALCLNKDAERRPSAKALLKHPFIRRAGRTDTLQEMVRRAKQFDETGMDRERDIRYYEETMKSMHHPSADDEDDEWVFDTIRPSATRGKHTIKRRKLERIPSGHAANAMDRATAALEHLSLDHAPLGSDAVPVTPAREGTTIRTPQVRHVSSNSGSYRRSSQRRVSGAAITARRVSGAAAAAAASPTSRRVSSRAALPPQPLGLDMSFGNGKSTVRQFQRVRSDVRPHTPPSHSLEGGVDLLSPQDSVVFDSDAENKPPPPPHARPAAAAAVPATKEALLGRRAYALCLDPALQETHAATANRASREALGRVAEALSRLDELDPEGELLLLRGIFDRVQADPKLCKALLPGVAAPTVPRPVGGSVRQQQHASVSAKRASVVTVVENSDLSTMAARTEPPSTPSKQSAAPPSAPGTPSRSPSKLVLNPQNPHLKKLRSSQPAQAQSTPPPPAVAALEEKMPGAAPEPGMEHTGLLADVLYGRWAEGLRVRWPGA